MNDDSYMMYTRIINSIQYICFICVCVFVCFFPEKFGIYFFFFCFSRKEKIPKWILTIRTKTNLFWKIKINQHLLFCIEFELILSNILHVFVCVFSIEKNKQTLIKYDDDDYKIEIRLLFFFHFILSISSSSSWSSSVKQNFFSCKHTHTHTRLMKTLKKPKAMIIMMMMMMKKMNLIEINYQ